MNNRFQFAVKLQRYNNETVLDLGCRDKALKMYLKQDIKYQGIDFEEGEEIISFNLENGIPFEDDSFDVVFALDVLEHLENIHFLMEEMKRVAKNEIILALPNCYHWHYKLNVLRNKPLNTKYKIPNQKIMDRHRWVTYHDANTSLVEDIYKNKQIVNYIFVCNYNKYKILFFMDSFLAKYFPNTFSYTDFFHIDLKK
jgi:SAM-dependent methyltransferase